MGFEYEFYGDAAVLAFMHAHPLRDFPHAPEVFLRLLGTWKADFFRYYYLYVRGGIYVDSDISFRNDRRATTVELLKSRSLVMVLSPTSSTFRSTSIFNGFIAASPRHPIMYRALRTMYWEREQNLTISRLGYMHNCLKLFEIYKEHHDSRSLLLQQRVRAGDVKVAHAVPTCYEGEVLFVHHFKFKCEPHQNPTNKPNVTLNLCWGISTPHVR